MENNLDNLKAMFDDFQKKSSKQGGSAQSRESILKKYFVPRNDKETFRILPPLAGRRHIEEAFFHVVPTIGKGGKVKHGTILYCPAHNDAKVPKLDENGQPIIDSTTNKPYMIPSPCPLCEKNRELLRKQDKSLRGIKKENMTPAQLEIKEENDKIYKEANKWSARRFYIIRGIDKGLEKDGVKFWRFKHNYKQQGALDKLLPVIKDFTDAYLVDFADPEKGVDLTITMADTEFQGRTYKQITAISTRQPSKLHSDDLVMRNWLNDKTTWRDVFKPKKAPNMTPVEFLESVVLGQNPYWDDSDANNKKWVFPGRPDLEEAANTRTRTFDDEGYNNFEQASDLNIQNDKGQNVNIGNVTKSDVGTNQDTAVDVGASALGEKPTTTYEQPQTEAAPTTSAPVETAPPAATTTAPTTSAPVDVDADEEDYDDLPF